MGLWLAVIVCLIELVSSNYPVFDVNTQMRLLLLPSDARIGSVIYRLRATDSDKDYPLIFAATDYGSYVIKIENLPCNKSSSYCEANVFLERSLIPEQLFKFRITVRDKKGDTTTLPVSIKVTNGVTDFNEVFPHIPGVIMIPEDTKVGTELEYIIVKKHPRYSRQAKIELWGADEFKLTQTSKKDTTTGIIKLIKALDYETQTMFKLSVFATNIWVDLDTDSRNVAGFQVVVIVTDVQDTPPIFDKIEPITKLRSNLTQGDVVLRVTARDGDKGIPRAIKYGLVSEGNPFTVFFSIDQDTGDIKLVRPLKELISITHSHHPILLTVVAEEVVVNNKNSNLSDISTTATVALLLDQSGNTPPYFASHNYVTHIAENSVQGTALVFKEPYITEIKDNDMGKKGVFSLSLENNNGTFEISPNVGERQTNFIILVRDNKLLDYEVNKELSFKIVAKELDPDQIPLSSSVDVVVYITDVNDNPPVFLKSNYSAEVPENVTAITSIIKVEATDVDTGDGGIVKYTAILGFKNSSLMLHRDNGVISIATDSHGFDREESSMYQFYVEARDMNGIGNRATVPFTLHILDVNDETPTFPKNPIEFILGPDGTNFSQRAFIKAYDADAEPPNNIVRYEIVNGNYGNRFILIADTGELLVNLRSRVTRQAKEAVFDLLVRAYDLGVPTRWSTVQVRIYPADSGARVMKFVVPGKNPDRATLEKWLSDLTGARVILHSVEPYFSNQGFYPSKATDLTQGSSATDKSIATATILYNNNAVVDLEALQKRLTNNRTAQIIEDSVTVYRTETRTLFWILMILIILIALALLTLCLCCFCEICPFYPFFSRLVRKKSAANTVTYVENEHEKENKSVQAEWIRGGRDAWSADQVGRSWNYRERVVLVDRPPNGPSDLIVEDVDGTEYRLLDPSRLSIQAQNEGRDEKFIKDGNAEILRLVTRGRDEEPNFHQPDRPYTIENDEEDKGVIMERFIDDDGVMKKVMDRDKELSTADVNKLTTIQRDLLLTRFLVEEGRRNRMAEDTQSLPGVVTMATQTDSHAQTQTERCFFKRLYKSDNEDSDSEENGRKFKRIIKRRLNEERVIDAFQNKSPILEEEPPHTPVASQNYTETKASLLRHAANRNKLEQPFLLLKTKSVSEQNLLEPKKDNGMRSLQTTPIRTISITNNVLMERVIHSDSQDEKELKTSLSLPTTQATKTLLKRQANSEPRHTSRQSSKESKDSSTETKPRYMEWYKKKREAREQERKQKQEPRKRRQSVEVDKEMNNYDTKGENPKLEDKEPGAINYSIPITSLRNQQVLEKKSIFTIAYDDMETRQIRIDTASTP